jgi:adenylate cyclase
LSNERLPRKLAAVLYADVAGYSRLTGADEDGTHRQLRSCLDAADQCVSQFGGRICHFAGDALLVDFPSAVSALDCAATMHRKFIQCNFDTSSEQKVTFRIGINLGEVIVDGDELYGDSVNIAARLEAIAPAGGTCVSRKVWEEVRGKVDYGFVDKGDVSVKNIETPIRVYEVLMDADGQQPAERETPTLAEKPSVAILALNNMSGDPEQEYFADGLTEDVITGLSRFRSINVIARNSTFAYKGQSVNIQKIGAELGADYVVEGSVRRAGNRVRITIQLIDARTDKHIWAQKYDRTLDDIFAVQDEVTQSILTNLPEYVEAADLEKGKRKPKAQMAAYDYYLKGREHHHRFSRTDCQEAIRCLEKAVELDPEFAPAWAWLGCSIGQAYVRSYLPEPMKLWRQCVQATRRGLEIDADDSECHRLMSEIYLLQNQFDQAEYHNERGLSLNPNCPRLVVQRGYLLAYVGRAAEGVEWVEKVLQLDPVHPEAYSANLGITLYLSGRYEDAIGAFQRVPALQSSHRAYLLSCLRQLGQESEATGQRDALIEAEPDFSIAQFERSLHFKSDADKARIVSDLESAGLPH